MILDKAMDLGTIAVTAATTYNSAAEGHLYVNRDAAGLTSQGQFGSGELVRVYIVVSTTATGGTSVQAQLVESDDGTNGTTPTVLVQTAAIATASLVRGYVFNISAVPVANLALDYIGINLISVGTDTTLVVKAFLAPWDQQTMKQGYPAFTGF